MPTPIIMGSTTPIYGTNWPLLGQAKLASSLRGVRGVGKQTAKAGKHSIDWYTGIKIALAGAGAAIGAYMGAYGLMRGTKDFMLSPQADLGNISVLQASSQQYGYGLLKGEGTGYIENIEPSTIERTRAYEEIQAPSTEQTAVAKIWAEQEARYEANLAYPTFPVQSTETAKATTKMPYTPRIQ